MAEVKQNERRRFITMKRLLLMTCLLLLTLAAGAKKKPKTDTDIFGKGTGTVYLFGVSQQLTDSVIYITTIQSVDSVDLTKKGKLLPFRSEYSLQLKEYMEGQLQLKNQTTCVFFSDKHKRLSKKLYKIKKRYLDDKETKIVMVDERYFRFKHPLTAVANEN